MSKPISERTQAMCRLYREGVAIGEIALRMGILPPGVRAALRTGGALPPHAKWYPGGPGRPPGGGKPGYSAQRREASIQHRDSERINVDALPRVDRDPCPRCGVRGDIGCAHSRAPLSMGAFA